MTYDPTTDTRPRCRITGPGIYEQADGGEARVKGRLEGSSYPWKGGDADGDAASWTDGGHYWADGEPSSYDLIRYLRPLDTEQPDPDALKALSEADLDAAEASAVEAARAPFKAERERRVAERDAWKAFVPEARQVLAHTFEARDDRFASGMARNHRLDDHFAMEAVARALASKATAK